MNKFFSLFCWIVIVLFSNGCIKDEKIGATESCILDVNDSSIVHPKAMEYQSLIDQFTAKGLPGISIAIRDKHGLWMGGSGRADIKNNINFSACHISKSASITKLLVATATFLLIEDGLFQLDDPINKYLTDKQLKGIKNAEFATIRSCLAHTTGIADIIKDQSFYLSVLNQPDKFWKEEELLDFVRGDDAVFEHGDSVKYSNTNTLLVAMVIEAVTGKDHSEIIREQILKPYSMNHTYYYWLEIPPAASVAQGYFDLYNNGTLVNVTNYNTGSGNGYGGLYSNALDLLRFVELLFREKSVLSPNSLNSMLTFGKPEKGKNRLLGLGSMQSFTERDSLQFGWGHSGRDLGYSADVFYFPNQDMTLSFLVNYGTDAESRLQSIFFEFRTSIVDEMMK